MIYSTSLPFYPTSPPLTKGRDIEAPLAERRNMKATVPPLTNMSHRSVSDPLLCKEGRGEVERDLLHLTSLLPHLTSPYKGEGD